MPYLDGRLVMDNKIPAALLIKLPSLLHVFCFSFNPQCHAGFPVPVILPPTDIKGICFRNLSIQTQKCHAFIVNSIPQLYRKPCKTAGNTCLMKHICHTHGMIILADHNFPARHRNQTGQFCFIRRSCPHRLINLLHGNKLPRRPGVANLNFPIMK